MISKEQREYWKTKYALQLDKGMLRFFCPECHKDLSIKKVAGAIPEFAPIFRQDIYNVCDEHPEAGFYYLIKYH